jgi:uncharacterized repeat protein (TIGR01451 family)
MGRRLLLILGMMLLSWLAAPAARAQTDGRDSSGPEAAPPVPPELPLTIPADLKALDALPAPGEAPDSKKTAAPRSGQARKPRRTSDPAATPAQGAEPPATPPATTSASPPAHAASTAGADPTAGGQPPARPPVGPPPPAGGSATPPGTSGLSADRLPLGKQSVAVTVDVQAPPSINLNQPATLKLVVKNTGASEAMNVLIMDELPEGLQYISSQPEPYRVGDSLLSWRLSALAAGQERAILVQVKPVKTGAYDHAATVTFQTGSKARTRVLMPLLKVDQTISTAKVLKGQSVEFKVTVSNIGDGPARNVTVRAKLSPGLRHGSGERSDDQMVYELTLPTLAAGQHEELDPLVADAIQGGDQSCTVTAESPDVLPATDEDKQHAQSVKTVAVVEPKLELTLVGPDKRYTDTIAPYVIKLANPGTAPARKVAVVATLPVSGRLVKVPDGASWDSTTRRLRWSFDRLETGSAPRALGFDVRMGGIGFYQVTAEARGEGALQARDRCSTDVLGMPDVDLVVSEHQRVVDVGGKTMFQVRLRNYGSKDATRLQVRAQLSKNLKLSGIQGGPFTGQALQSPDRDQAAFELDKLARGKEVVLGIEVEVVGPEPKMATCRVFVTHDDLTDPFEDMAAVKVMTTRRPEPAGS